MYTSASVAGIAELINFAFLTKSEMQSCESPESPFWAKIGDTNSGMQTKKKINKDSSFFIYV